MNTHNKRLVCELERMKKYTHELEHKLNDYDKIVAERAAMQEKADTGLRLLDSIENKQTCLFDEVICRYNELCEKHAIAERQLDALGKENECLRSLKEQMCGTIADQKEAIVRLNGICSALQEDSRCLRKQCADVMDSTHSIRDSQRETETKLVDMCRKMDCARNAESADKQMDRLRDKCVGQLKEECLCAIKALVQTENENLVRWLRTEVAGLREQCDDKLSKMANVEQGCNENQRECQNVCDKMRKLKRILDDNHETCRKTACDLGEELRCLRADVKSLNAEFMVVDGKLANVQTENLKLRDGLDEQVKVTKGLMMAEENLRQELKRNKQTIDLATQKFTIERNQRLNEMQVHERTSMLESQEMCEIRQLIEDQGRQIKKLKAQLACGKSIAREPNKPLTKPSPSEINTFLKLLHDENDNCP